MLEQYLKMIDDLNQIEEDEGEAHRLFDDANSNLAYGRLSPEMRDGYVKQTYRGTGLHAASMERVRSIRQQLREIVSAAARSDN